MGEIYTTGQVVGRNATKKTCLIFIIMLFMVSWSFACDNAKNTIMFATVEGDSDYTELQNTLVWYLSGSFKPVLDIYSQQHKGWDYKRFGIGYLHDIDFLYYQIMLEKGTYSTNLLTFNYSINFTKEYLYWMQGVSFKVNNFTNNVSYYTLSPYIKRYMGKYDLAAKYFFNSFKSGKNSSSYLAEVGYKLNDQIRGSLAYVGGQYLEESGEGSFVKEKMSAYIAGVKYTEKIWGVSYLYEKNTDKSYSYNKNTIVIDFCF